MAKNKNRSEPTTEVTESSPPIEMSEFDKFANEDHSKTNPALLIERQQAEIAEPLDVTDAIAATMGDAADEYALRDRHAVTTLKGAETPPLDAKEGIDPLLSRSHRVLTELMIAGLVSPFAHQMGLNIRTLIIDIEKKWGKENIEEKKNA